jgi:hypothetical protein
MPLGPLRGAGPDGPPSTPCVGSGLVLPARAEPQRAVLAVVRHQRRADRDQQGADGAVVQALSQDPDPSAIAVKMQGMRDVRRHGRGRQWSIRSSFVGCGARILQPSAAIVVLSLILAGCGGSGSGGERAASTAAPATTQPAATQAPPTATATAPASTPAPAPAAPPAQTTTLGEGQAGGGGDEQGIASKLQYALSGSTASPASASAPAFIRIALTFRSADGRAHSVRVALPVPVTLAVPAGGAVTKQLDGQRKGSYSIAVDGAQPSARVVVG